MSQPIHTLSPAQQDALKEAFNMGSGQAATTLSEILSRRVMVSVPVVGISGVEEMLGSLAKPTHPVLCLVNIFAGDISGCTIWLIPQSRVDEFARICYDHLPQDMKGDAYNPIEVHRRVSSILTETYLNTMGDLLELMIVPSTPISLSGVLQSVLGKILQEYSKSSQVVAYIETKFGFDGEHASLSGFFMMLPDGHSLEKLLTILKVNQDHPG